MPDKREDITKYLRHIGDDFAPEDESQDTSPECGGGEFCPKHKDCGICRFEYMKRKGWLNQTVYRSEGEMRGWSAKNLGG